ncbi:MAG TPA: carbon-nitrogen hydrolase family protein, partial [Anaerolineales bacterium]|nr:carbon-nitrogen hydrolase family protein [Anaerolineales bacterium]
MPKIRVSAIQYAVTSDVDANLASTLRMIDVAAKDKPNIIVTPEFINHILWFDDNDHCWRVSVDLDGDFLKAIGDKAKEHNCYIKVNVTLQREQPKVTGTNILFDPNGNQIAVTDKQILMGNENNFLTPATEPAQIVETPFGNLGMYCCMDGVIPEPARALAVRGAHILLNSLNSFAHDE